MNKKWCHLWIRVAGFQQRGPQEQPRYARGGTGQKRAPGHPAAASLRPQSSPHRAPKAASQHRAKAPAAEPAFKSSLFGFSTSFNESQIY